ncbi:2785_t:CDS:2 [Paraglomus occultum]|uniref:2785_t:CDS:1 n=1 Tax=Paraglomus occultum TaxID=144539 RepID=A0A9N9BVM2_9GLOM|nr:2785_t:CDS:2 [Paraglomus occultum]
MSPASDRAKFYYLPERQLTPQEIFDTPERYGKLHGCQMFMVNLCTEVAMHGYFGKLTPGNVIIDYDGWKDIINYTNNDKPVSISGSDWDILFTV